VFQINQLHIISSYSDLLEVGFKPNSIPQNQLVRWGLHPTYILWIDLIFGQYGTSNTPSHAKVYTSRAWDYKWMGDPLAGR